jgi:hypothetical protein
MAHLARHEYFAFVSPCQELFAFYSPPWPAVATGETRSRKALAGSPVLLYGGPNNPIAPTSLAASFDP